MERYLLLDVGGTGVKGAYWQDGALSNIIEYPSEADKNAVFLLNHLCAMLIEQWRMNQSPGQKLGGIGMAFPGPFDYERGVPLMKGLNKYECLYGMELPAELVRLLSPSFHPTELTTNNFFFLNDVSAYALGVLEKAKTYGRTMYVCLGTGAGSAYTIDGRLCVNEREGIPPDGWIFRLPFGDTILDDYLSARGIQRLSEERCHRSMTPRQLFDQAEAGDSNAACVFQDFGQQLTVALSPLLAAFHADTLVLGGKISLASHWFIQPMMDECLHRHVKLLIQPDTSTMTLYGLSAMIRRNAKKEF